MQSTSFMKTGTAGGTLIILFANINADDLLKTVVLAAVGATVSLIVSFVLKRMFGKKQ